MIHMNTLFGHAKLGDCISEESDSCGNGSAVALPVKTHLCS